MSRTSFALGGVFETTREVTAGAGGVGVNDIVYLDNATNTVLPISTAMRKAYGFAQNAAAAAATMAIVPGLPGVYRTMRFADPSLYAATMIQKHFGITGSSGAHRVDLSDTTNTVVKLIRREYDYSLSEYVGVIELAPVKTVKYTISDEAANVITTTLQVLNPDGSNANGIHRFNVVVSSSATTGAEAATTPSGALAASTGTIVVVYTAKKNILLQTNVTGGAVLTLEDNAVNPYYLHSAFDGNVSVSDVLNFA